MTYDSDDDIKQDGAFTFFFGGVIGAVIMAVVAWRIISGENTGHRKAAIKAGIAHYSPHTGEYIEDSTVVHGDTIFVIRLK